MKQETSIGLDLERLGALPRWLTAPMDPQTVQAALTEAITEFRSRALALEAATLKRARLEGDTWSTRFELTVADSHGPKTVTVAGSLASPSRPPAGWGPPEVPLGDPEWRCEIPPLGLGLWTPPPDAALPALPVLSDPEQSRSILEAAIGEGSSHAGIRIRACMPNLVRYKPGSRCTFVYRLEYEPDDQDRGWPDVVVAKTYKGAKGRNAYDGMRALWGSGLGRGDVVRIAEPLAFIPDLNVLVQGGIGEDSTLKTPIQEALESGAPEDLDTLNGFLRQTARGLAALHQSGVHPEQQLTWEDELAEVREIAASVAHAAPETAGAADDLLDALEGRAAASPAQRAGPAHRSFRPAQVLIHRGSIGFIDFDGFCRCEPAVDVALFRASLRQFGAALPLHQAGAETPLTDRLDRLDGFCDLFLDAYEAAAPIDRERVALWEALDILTNLLNCWVKIRSGRVEVSLMLLERHLARSGAAG
jgi:hypothetical protein